MPLELLRPPLGSSRVRELNWVSLLRGSKVGSEGFLSSLYTRNRRNEEYTNKCRFVSNENDTLGA